MARRKPESVGAGKFLAETGRRPTSYDVARIAGVSQSAVSRCFAPNASIAPAKRELILKVASEIGYRPNALAQALISKRTNIVAVLISNLTNLYYPEVLSGLTTALENRDIRVLLFNLVAERAVDDVIDQVWRHSVDGVIAAARLSELQLAQFAEHRIPVVMYNRMATGPNAASVRCDSTGGERDLVERLIASGHRHFGLIAGPEDSYVGEERRLAALAALADAGIAAPPEVRGDFSYESGRRGMLELASGKRKFDAVICASDLMAIGAMDAARIELGRKVPDELSIVGFDGSGPAAWASYALTTVRQPVERMTEAAVAMLMERIEDGAAPAEQRLFSGALVKGASARIGA